MFPEEKGISSPSLKIVESAYIKWLNRVERKNKFTWKGWGIYNLVQFSRVALRITPSRSLSLYVIGRLQQTLSTFLVGWSLPFSLIWMLLLVYGQLEKNTSLQRSWRSNLILNSLMSVTTLLLMTILVWPMLSTSVST